MFWGFARVVPRWDPRASEKPKAQSSEGRGLGGEEPEGLQNDELLSLDNEI